jgi:UDPglucose--hexose-1-phosphate uridylyltransferase
MGLVELRREVLNAEFLHPAHGFERVTIPVEVRWDPLTGHSSRLVVSGHLMPRSDFDLEAFARENQPRCPFCTDRIEQQTPRFPEGVWPQGRITRGEAVLFPNLLAYAAHSAVSVYSPKLHFLPLERITARLVADNLAAQVIFARAAIAADPAARWVSINANHMLPSGSSLFHPHLQGSVDPVPTNFQRLLAEVPAERYRAYLDAEIRAGRRYLGSSGRVHWLASFAPLAPCELRAFISEVATPTELDDELVEELGAGIATALGLYAELGFESFNMAAYGAPPATSGYPFNVRLVCRSNLSSCYRSDATYYERLHWEAAIDISPEELAERAGSRFRA